MLVTSGKRLREPRECPLPGGHCTWCWLWARGSPGSCGAEGWPGPSEAVSLPGLGRAQGARRGVHGLSPDFSVLWTDGLLARPPAPLRSEVHRLDVAPGEETHLPAEPASPPVRVQVLQDLDDVTAAEAELGGVLGREVKLGLGEAGPQRLQAEWVLVGPRRPEEKGFAAGWEGQCFRGRIEVKVMATHPHGPPAARTPSPLHGRHTDTASPESSRCPGLCWDRVPAAVRGCGSGPACSGSQFPGCATAVITGLQAPRPPGLTQTVE